MSKRTFRMFVEEELGEFPHFVVGAILEWFLIASLFVDGFLAFISYKFAMIFQLDPPCVLCTRIDQSLAGTNPSSYYNDSICESHKKDISSLAYCHFHRKLSDIKTMCDCCLLSFQTCKEPDSNDTKKPVDKEVGITNGSDQNLKLKLVKTKDNNVNAQAVELSKCSCCGESFKKRTSSKAFVRIPSNLRASSFAPAFSPRVPLTPMGWRHDDAKDLELANIKYTELKFISDNESDVPENDRGVNTDSQIVKDDVKSTATALLADSEELNDEFCITPRFGKGNKFFGVPLADSVTVNSPRFARKLSKKFPMEKPELVSDPSDDIPVEGDSILHHLKRQVRADRRMLTVLYQELNEERNASAIAANNSMAMITRLQAEKASIEMEALQYQRMMEEQAEYDQEAIQILKDMLIQKEKDIKIMELELENYRERYGPIKKHSRYESIGEDDERYQEIKRLQEMKEAKRLNFETQRSQLSIMLNDLENLIQSSSDAGDHEDKHRGEEKKVTLEREMSIIKERMSVIEADSGYLDDTAMTFQKGDERAGLFTEIAQNLRKLRT
uniref:probable myosin-binding protein 5 n=1 Tax=Erigeron canadensis TaxID=72917 RepID=UPI001CB959B1|nr:probable myosin-binding protein 5 [Erigeron canadensis]